MPLVVASKPGQSGATLVSSYDYPVASSVCRGMRAPHHMERDIKEAWHRMKREIGANAGRRSVAHSRLLAALGVLAACLALATGTGTVFATPSGPGLSVSPGEAAPGKTVTVKGSPEKNPYGPGDQIVIGYAQGDCSNGVTAINGATGTADGKGNISINVTIPTTDPSPVPLPTSLVVKNGSKILSMISGGIPLPVSATSTST